MADDNDPFPIPSVATPSAGGGGMSDIDYMMLASQLGGTSADAEKRAILAKQMEMAQTLREGAQMPRGQYIPGYKGVGVYVPPSPWQQANAVLGQVLGAQMGKKYLGQEQDITAEEAQNRTNVMKMLAQHLRNQQQSQQYAQANQPQLQDIAMPNAQNMPTPNFNITGGATAPGGGAGPAPTASAAPPASPPVNTPSGMPTNFGAALGPQQYQIQNPYQQPNLNPLAPNFYRPPPGPSTPTEEDFTGLTQ
jgi:hypothetical protein